MEQMGNIISRFEKAIQRVNLIYGLLIPVLIGVVMGRILNFINPNFFNTDPLATTIYYFLVASGVMVFIVHLITKGGISRLAHIFLYIFYCLSLTLLVVFLDPYPTPFYFQFIILLIAIDLLFGERWFRVSIVYFAAVFFLSYVRSTDTITAEGVVLALTYIVGSTSLAVLVSQYRRISDEERKTLGVASRQTSFERQRLLSLINNMGDAVMATDDKGKILLYNAALLDLLDTNESLEGKLADSVLKLKDKKHQSVAILKKLKDKSMGLTSRDYRHEFKHGDAINLYLNVSPIKLGFKQHVQSGYIFILRDITKEKSLEEERDEFISVVSHELRTPVTIAEGNISNALYVSKKHHDPKFVLNSLSQAHDQVMFLAGMINDLATLSRAERTDQPMELTSVDPAEILESIQRNYQHEAAAKKLKFVATSTGEVKKITTCELYLREILQNFVVNAIKYTKKGSVIAHARTDKDGNAIFTVTDTGLGLSKADLKKIFEKFFRSEDYRIRETSGTGLGLYVTEKLAHRLKASISVESELNKGSTFTVVVPSLKK